MIFLKIALLLNIIRCQFIDTMVLELNPGLKTLNTDTSYELNVLLPRQLNSGSTIVLDFSDSKIGVADRALSICYYTPQIVYTNCNCVTQVCTIVTTTTVSSGGFYILMIGNLTNPPYQGSQIVNVRINYAQSTYYTTKQATIDGQSYIPGEIQFISLGQSSQKVGQNNAYSFIFKPSNNLQTGSKIDIRMPTELTIQENPVIYASIYDTVKTNIQFQIIMSQNIEIIITSLFQDTLQVDGSKFFNITISGIKNPQSVSNSSSFFISTTTQNDELIDYVHDGIIATATIPEVIGSLSIMSAVDSTINTINNQLFFVARPALPFFYGGKLQIVFPSQFSINTVTQQCLRQAGLAISSGIQYNCLVSGGKVTTVNLIYPQSTTDIYIRIYGVVNPKSTKPTDSFVLQTYDSHGNIMCVSQQQLTFQATPGILVILENIMRSNAYVSKNIEISGQIKLTNPIDQGSYVRVTIDISQAKYIGPLVCKQKISDVSQVSVNCSLLYSNTSGSAVQFQEWCSAGTSRCNSTSTMSFIISGFQNPQFIKIGNIDSLILSTYTPDLLGQYDQISTNVILQPALQANTLTDISFLRSGSQYVADLSSLQISFTPTDYFMNNRGKIKIYFARYTTYQDTLSQSVKCTINSIPYNYSIEFYQDSLNSIKTILIEGICGENSCQGPNLTIFITNLRNPISQYPLGNVSGDTDYFGIQTYTDDNLTISFGKASTYTGYTNIVNNNINAPIIQISDLTIGITTRYQIQITPTIEINNLQHGGYINLTFPTDIQVSNSSLCMALASNHMLNCTVDFYLQTIQISYSVTPSSVRDSQLSIIIDGLRSPQTSKPSGSLWVRSFYLGQYVQQTWEFQVQSIKPYPLQVNIIRNEIQINKNVEFTINMTTFNPLPQGSQIRLTIPFDQMVFPQFDVEKFLVLTRNSQQIIFFVEHNSPQQLTIIFQDLMCPCPSGGNLVYKLTGGINPNGTRPPLNSIQISIKDVNNYDIEGKNSSLIAEPSPSEGPLIINSLLSTSLVSGTNTSLQLTVTPSNAIVKGGKLIIFFPSGLYFGTGAVCVVNSEVTPCQTTYNSSDIGSYIETIQFVICGEMRCPSLAAIEIEIRNLLNNPTTRQNDLNIIISTCEGDGYFIDTGSVSARTLSQLTPNVLFSSSIVRSNNTVDSATNIDIEIISNNVWPANSLVKITFPSDQILTHSITACKRLTGSKYTHIMCQIVGQTVVFEDLCGGSCPALNKINVRIENLLNYYMESDLLDTLIEVQTRNFLAIEQKTLQITPTLVRSAFSSVSIDLSSLVVGQETFLVLQVLLNTQQPPNTTLSIIILERFLRQSLQQTCQIYLDNIYVPAATCAPIYAQDYLTSLSIQNFNPITIQGANITVQLGLLNDFYCKILNNKFVISTNYKNQFISSLNYTLNLALLPVVFKQVNIIRSNSVLNQSVNISIQITIPTPLLLNSQILLALPKDQVQIPINVQCTEVSCSLSQDSEFYYLTFPQSMCQDYCPSGYNMNFTIINILNPLYKKLFSSNFQILTTYQGIVVNSSPGQLNISPDLQSPNRLGVSIQRDNGLKSKAVVYTIQIISTFVYEANSQLAIIFPDSLIFTSSNPQIYLNGSLITPQLTLKNFQSHEFVTVLMIPILCQLIACNQPSHSFTITLRAINNPSYYPLQGDDVVRISIVNFQQIVQAEENFLKELIMPVFNYNDFQGLQLIRTDATLGQETSLQLLFSLNYQPKSNSLIVLTIPKIQIIAQSISCLRVQDQQFLPCSLTDSAMWFEIQFESQPGQIGIQIDNFLNPTITFNKIDINSAKLQIVSLDRQVMFSQVNEDLFISPSIYVNHIQDFIVSRDIQNAGMQTTYSFGFISPVNLQNNTLVILQLPLNLAYTYLSSNCYLVLLQETQPLTCQYSTVNLTTQNSVIQVEIFNLCVSFPSKCVTSEWIQVNLQMMNQGYVKDYQTGEQFQILLNLNGSDFSRGSYDAGLLMPILPGIISNEGLKLSSYKVLDTNVQLSVNFTLTNEFLNTQNNGQILFKLPSLLGQQPLSCSAKILLSTQHQPFINCKQIAPNQFIIQHSLTQKIKNQKIMLVVQGMENAPDNRRLDDFTIQTSGLINSEIYIIDKSQNQLQYQASLLGGIEVQVLRDNNALYHNAVFTFILKLEHALQAGGSLAIGYMNSNQAMANSSIPLVCKNVQNTDLPCFFQGDYIIISNVCQTNCSHSLTVIVSQGLMNVGFFMNLQPTDSFEIFTLYSSNTTYTDGNSTNIFASPVLSSGVLGVSSFNQSSKTAQSNTLLSFVITNRQSIFFQNNRLIIYFSRGIFMQGGVLLCVVNNMTKNCHSTLMDDDVTTINIDQICSNNLKCSPGTSFLINIQGLRNYYYELGNSFINMTTYSSDTRNKYQIIDTVQFNKRDYLYDIIPAQIEHFSVTQFVQNSIIEIIFESLTVLPNSVILLTSNMSQSFRQSPECRETLIFGADINCSIYNLSALIIHTHDVLLPGVYSFKISHSNSMNVPMVFKIDLLTNNFQHVLQQSVPTVLQTRDLCLQPSDQPYLGIQCTSICPQYQANMECYQCYSSCLTCSGTSSLNCTSCVSGFLLSMNQCVEKCPSTQSVNQQCINNNSQSCNSTCTTCGLDTNFCYTCKPTLTYDKLTGRCLAPSENCSGSQFKNNGVCNSCSFDCLQCGQSKCTVCKPEFGRYVNSTNQCIQNCVDGYFVSGISCMVCSTSCLTCSMLSNNCTSCLSKQILYQGTCVPQCLANHTFLNGTCRLQCDQTCETCSQLPDNCTSCYNSQILYKSRCEDCLPNYTLVDGSCYLVCVNQRCGECQTDLSSCTTCSALYPLHKDTDCIRISDCANGFFIDGSKCLKCSSNCLTCETHQTNCTSCNQGKILFESSCLEACPENYYLSNDECLKKCINKRCDTCLPDLITCITCLQDYPIRYTNQCIKQSECSGNLFLLDNVCELCDKTCETCQENSTHCTSCTDNLILFENMCYLQCPLNYSLNYLSEIKECLPFICKSPCDKCGSSEHECASCVDEFPLIYMNQCYVSCPTSTYTQNNICIQCSKGCLTCNSNTCERCVQDQLLYNQQCLSECPQGYSPEDGICKSIQIGIFGIVLLILLFICFFYSLISAIINKILLGFWISLGTLIGCVEQISKGVLVFYLAEGLAQYQFTITATSFMIQSSIAMIFTFMKFEILAKNEQQVNSFERNNPKWFKAIMTLSCIFGVQLIRITEGCLIGIPRTNYYNSKFVYRLIIKQLTMSFLVNIVQFGVDLSILATYTLSFQCYHVAYLNILLNTLILFCYVFEKLNISKICLRLFRPNTDLSRVHQDISKDLSMFQTNVEKDLSQIQMQQNQ